MKKKATVAHHEKRRPIYERYADESASSLEQVVGIVAANPEFIDIALPICENRFYSLAYLNRPEAASALSDYVECLIGELIVSANVGRRVSYTFRGRTYSAELQKPMTFPGDWGTWNLAFMGATVLNHERYLKLLMGWKPDDFLTVSKFPRDYRYEVMSALQSVHEGRDDALGRIDEALEVMGRVPGVALDFDTVSLCDRPAMELLAMVLRGSQRGSQRESKRGSEDGSEADYQVALKKAIESYKDHAKKWRKRVESTSLLASLPLTMIAAFARRTKGYTCNVESSYVPQVLIDDESAGAGGVSNA